MSDQAVELWWAIKNVGATARDEPRFAQRADQGGPIIFPTRKEAAAFCGRWFAKNAVQKVVRVEVRER